jgi:hypothetical protein
MVLNGYTNGVRLFGEGQWPQPSHDLFRELLPFAHVVSRNGALHHIRNFGGHGLVELSQKHWFVMKTFVALAIPPVESCLMDDGVFILDHLTDALEQFHHCDLVYTPDQDLGDGYVNTWRSLLRRSGSIATNRLTQDSTGSGTYPRLEQSRTPRFEPALPRGYHFLWEQELIAVAYANQPTCELLNQRYLFPLFDGLPGGLLGYDYAVNPCGFVSIHYGGLAEKPSDEVALQLFGAIVGRRRNAPRKHVATA